MKRNYKYKLMLASEGGMTDGDSGRDVRATNDDLARMMGKWIIDTLDNEGVADAEVTITITMEDNERFLR